eukprot:11732416-Prorocentrum_lima.AAC.1
MKSGKTFSRASGDAVLQQGGKSARYPDGRRCHLCSVLDSEWDPVDGEPVYIWWGYPPDEQGKTIGEYCYYCVRVHTG